MNCKKHRRYQAKRQPRVACRECWKAFFKAEKERATLRRLASHYTMSDWSYADDDYFRNLGRQ